MADARAGEARMPRMKVASDRRLILRRFFRRPAAILGFAIVALFVLCALFAPFLAPYGPDQPDFSKARRGPSPEHWLGNDELGRDLFSRLLYGARISGMIGVIAVAIGLVLGVPMGLISGFYGGWIDAADDAPGRRDAGLSQHAARHRDGGDLGPGLTNAILAVGVVAVPVYVRLVRASTLSVKELDYISAARALGASDARLMWRHVLPQCLGPILVQSSLQMAAAILAAAGLGFLGLGAPPDVPEWGTMLAKGRTYIFSAPHLTMYPGLAILLVVMGFNLLGDALRDALDPRIG